MKTLTIVLIGLLLVSFIFVIYDFNNNENIKRNAYKVLNKPCELKTFPNGYTQIENCAMYKYVGALDMKVALSEGELINPNAPMTRSQVITKLTEAKELFELDMMTEQEYLEIKKEVTPIIKNK